MCNTFNNISRDNTLTWEFYKSLKNPVTVAQTHNLMHAFYFVINLRGAPVSNRQRFIFETRLRGD